MPLRMPLPPTILTLVSLSVNAIANAAGGVAANRCSANPDHSVGHTLGVPERDTVQIIVFIGDIVADNVI